MNENAHNKYIDCVERVSPRKCDNETLLYMIAEEASEVVKAATKILRFGHDNGHPSRFGKEDNKDDLYNEIIDLYQVAHTYLMRVGVNISDIDFEESRSVVRFKRDRLKERLR